MATTAKDQFDWHITQATFHVSKAINMSLSSHQIGLSEAEKAILESIQNDLETIQSRNS